MWRHIPGVKRPVAESAVAMNLQTVDGEVKKKRRYFSNKWYIDDEGKTREWLVYLSDNQSTTTNTTTNPKFRHTLNQGLTEVIVPELHLEEI